VEYTSVFAKKKAAFETHLLSNASPAMNPGSSTYTNSGFGIIGKIVIRKQSADEPG
jgi:hypothetical protein